LTAFVGTPDALPSLSPGSRCPALVHVAVCRALGITTRLCQPLAVAQRGVVVTRLTRLKVAAAVVAAPV
jgi:hypothetical protein